MRQFDVGVASFAGDPTVVRVMPLQFDKTLSRAPRLTP
jgi:hypothetical protein